MCNVLCANCTVLNNLNFEGAKFNGRPIIMMFLTGIIFVSNFSIFGGNTLKPI